MDYWGKAHFSVLFNQFEHKNFVRCSTPHEFVNKPFIIIIIIIIWKSVWVFFLRLEGCLLWDHLPPNKPNFHLITDHLPHFQISDIRPEGCLNTEYFNLSNISYMSNISYQTRRLSEYFNILISDWKVIHICNILIYFCN